MSELDTEFLHEFIGLTGQLPTLYAARDYGAGVINILDSGQQIIANIPMTRLGLAMTLADIFELLNGLGEQLENELAYVEGELEGFKEHVDVQVANLSATLDKVADQLAAKLGDDEADKLLEPLADVIQQMEADPDP